MRRVMVGLLALFLFVGFSTASACNDTVCFTSARTPGTLIALREGPSANARVIMRLYSGVGLDVLSHNGDWLQVRMPELSGFPSLVGEEGTLFDETPHGYLHKEDILEVNWMDTSAFWALLPTATLPEDDGRLLCLPLSPESESATQVAFLPETRFQVFGVLDEYALVYVQDMFAYAPEALLVIEKEQTETPADHLWERASYYDDFPLAFALVKARDGAAMEESTLGHTYPRGTVVQLLREEGIYAYVRTVDDEGYMRRDALLLDGDAGKRTLFGIRDMRARVSGETFVLRAFPDKNAPVIAEGDAIELQVLGLAGDWFYVQFTASWTGTTLAGFLRPNEWCRYGIGMRGETDYGIVLLPEDQVTLPLYAFPGRGAPVIAEYFHTTQVQLLAPLPEDIAAGDFAPVLVDGHRGFMEAIYIDSIQRDSPSVW